MALKSLWIVFTSCPLHRSQSHSFWGWWVLISSWFSLKSLSFVFISYPLTSPHYMDIIFGRWYILIFPFLYLICFSFLHTIFPFYCVLNLMKFYEWIWFGLTFSHLDFMYFHLDEVHNTKSWGFEAKVKRDTLICLFISM